MYAVITCKKYRSDVIADNTRVVDIGSAEPKALIDSLGPMECPICGPMSHVELQWAGYWSVLSTHSKKEEAIAELAKVYPPIAR